MKRREFITLFGGAAVAWPLAARAQQPAMPVIGFLHSESRDPIRGQIDAFQRALNEAGYTEGQNVAIEYRWAQGQFDKVQALVADLVRRQVAVIVAGGGTAAAAKAAGGTIPIIFTTGSDPVRQGLVASLSRPDGNMTGVAFFVIAMGPKQLEMLLAAVPNAMLIGFLSDPNYPYANIQIDELQAAVRSLGRKIVVQPVTNEAEIEPAFTALSKQGIDALIVGGDPFFTGRREQIIAQAAQHALPPAMAGAKTPWPAA
jgi:putative ABC transport system substrate-binding protein